MDAQWTRAGWHSMAGLAGVAGPGCKRKDKLPMTGRIHKLAGRLAGTRSGHNHKLDGRQAGVIRVMAALQSTSLYYRVLDCTTD